MKIVVTNDDGIYSEGIKVLSDVADEFGEVTVVAPRHHHSGCSHQMTFDGHLNAADLGGRRHWVDGFPVDCVRIALDQICPDADLIVSGVNHGSNLGLDNYLSGTVAAAREATFFGLPAIAFSQYHKGLDEEIWKDAKVLTRRLMEYLLDDRLKAGHYWNVNFPMIGEQNAEEVEIVEAEMDLSPLPNHYEVKDGGYYYAGDYHARKYFPDTDVAVNKQGNVSITRVEIGSPQMVASRARTSS